MALGVASLLGFLKPNTGKSKLVWVGVIVLIVGIVWVWAKWDSWTIKKLEKENQALEVESQSSQKAAQDAEAIRTIDEDAVTKTLDRNEQIDQDTSTITEKVREDVRRLQRELEEERRARAAAEERAAGLEDALEQPDESEQPDRPQPEPTSPSTEQRDETPGPRVVVRTVEVPGPAVDARIAQRIVDGMWDNYCRQVPDDRACAPDDAGADDTSGQPAQQGSLR